MLIKKKALIFNREINRRISNNEKVYIRDTKFGTILKVTSKITYTKYGAACNVSIRHNGIFGISTQMHLNDMMRPNEYVIDYEFIDPNSIS